MIEYTVKVSDTQGSSWRPNSQLHNNGIPVYFILSQTWGITTKLKEIIYANIWSKQQDFCLTGTVL